MTTPLQNLLADVKAGHRLTENEAHQLFSVRDAGASGSNYLDPKDMERIVTDIGRKLRQRTTLYEIV